MGISLFHCASSCACARTRVSMCVYVYVRASERACSCARVPMCTCVYTVCVRALTQYAQMATSDADFPAPGGDQVWRVCGCVCGWVGVGVCVCVCVCVLGVCV